MFHRRFGMPASFQNIIETNQVALNVCIRIGDGISYARLRCEVYNDRRLVIRKEAVDYSAVRQIALDKMIGTAAFGSGFFNFRKPPLLDAYIVIIVYVIQPDDSGLRLGLQQLQHQVRTDETGGTGHENCFSGKIDILHVRPP